MSELQLQGYSMPMLEGQVEASKLLDQSIGSEWGLGVVSLDAFGTPVSQIIYEVANQLEISVLVPELPSTKVMTASYDQAPGQNVIEDLAAYIGMVADYDGQTLRFLSQDRSTFDFIVLRSGYKPASELVQDLTGLLGSDARVKAVDDRVIVSGTRRDLEQVKRFEKHLQTGPDGWQLNVRIVAVTESFRRDLGLDWDLSARGGLNVTELSSIATTQLVVQVVAEATQIQSDAVLYNTATLYVLEGSTSEISQGRRVPVPRFSTSPEGTTTTVGYDYVDAGFSLKVAAERVPAGVRLKLEPSISNVVGFVQDAPITEQSSVVADVIMRDGEWVIITGLSTEQTSSDYKGIPGMKRSFGTESRLMDKSSLLVMVQARRIFGTESD
ncbi:MAG: hypothetical protein JKY95_00250 [Planctomycetaceae bacterium]|nr:hypothetical protein [Planctomycetaceae bacterium]